MAGPFTVSQQKTMGEQKKYPYYSLRDKVDSWLRFAELGILVALPLVVSFYSSKWCAGILLVEFLSLYLGILICDFDRWYNYRNTENQIEEVQADKTVPVSELEEILDRLTYFENNYLLSIKSLYRFLDRDEIPFHMNNLDWLEIVSLLNRLSLTVGKRFDTK